MKILDFSNNQLSVIFDAVSNAKSLAELNLSNNKIEKLPDSFGELSGLEKLDLRNNKLASLPPSFGNLTKITSINFDENQLEVIPASFSNLVQLKDISLAKNKIKTIEDGAFKTLVNLTMLDLHQNNIQGVFNSVPASEKLDSLLLSYNFISEVHGLEVCPNVSVVDLHNN